VTTTVSCCTGSVSFRHLSSFGSPGPLRQSNAEWGQTLTPLKDCTRAAKDFLARGILSDLHSYVCSGHFEAQPLAVSQADTDASHARAEWKVRETRRRADCGALKAAQDTVSTRCLCDERNGMLYRLSFR
jgi:hypothetical protein